MSAARDDNTLLPPQSPENEGKKTLVLDLDETLVHSSFEQIQDADLVVRVKIDSCVVPVYVKKRPGLDDFLKEAAEIYELVTFTASQATYADPVLNALDPLGYISHRLFREHCIYFNGEYVKDLSRLGRPISKIVLLDVTPRQNSPNAYLFHPNNGMPIRSFIDDAKDRELPEALRLLREMQHTPDVPSFLMPHLPILTRRATSDYQVKMQTL